MSKDTLRLILFLKCNMACPYCCNKQPPFRAQFQEQTFSEIDFTQYSNICITGGEPFLDKPLLYSILKCIPADKNLFLYTNGLLIDEADLVKLRRLDNLRCVNVGLHAYGQLSQICRGLDDDLPVRFSFQDTMKRLLFALYPHRLTENNTKAWKMNDCARSNEDWVLLSETEGVIYGV